MKYWKTKHSNLLIADAREDICNECYIYANRHKYQMSRKPGDAADAARKPAEKGDNAEVVDDGEGHVNLDAEIAAMVEGKKLVLRAMWRWHRNNESFINRKS
jgi:hypothetical protein